MKKENFYKLINEDKFQVFLFGSTMSIPFSFAIHTWLVTVENGKIDRWDVWGYKNRCKTSWGHVHQNLYDPWLGVRVFIGRRAKSEALRFDSYVINNLSGGEASLAEKMISFLKDNASKYPYCNKYGYFPGPNSNTFCKWIIDNFPESSFELPTRALGGNYKEGIKAFMPSFLR